MNRTESYLSILDATAKIQFKLTSPKIWESLLGKKKTILLFGAGGGIGDMFHQT